jgi:DNA-binding MarR family transcriptional regulator
MDNTENNHVNFSKDFGRLITHLNRLRKRFMSDRLKSYGLGGSMYMFILSLDRNPGASQDFLVERFFMDKGNVARSAKRLEELGYIRREIDPGDRRQYMLYLTGSGKELIPVIRSYLTEWSECLSANFSDEERRTATELLERMAENSRQFFGSL